MSYNETVMQKLERQRQELRMDMLKREQEQKEAKREMVGMAIVVPVAMGLAALLYFGTWAIVPSAWW